MKLLPALFFFVAVADASADERHIVPTVKVICPLAETDSVRLDVPAQTRYAGENLIATCLWEDADGNTQARAGLPIHFLPEPSRWLMLAAGIGLLSQLRRRT